MEPDLEDGGWLDDIKWNPTLAHWGGLRMVPAQAVVLHVMQGYPRYLREAAMLRPHGSDARGQWWSGEPVAVKGDGESELADFRGLVIPIQKSAHFTIGRDGYIEQHVSLKRSAWHAGKLRRPSWSLANDLRDSWPPNPNRRTIGIELEGFSIPPTYSYDYVYGPDDPWPYEMIEAEIRVLKRLFEGGWIDGEPEWGSNVIGHHHIDSLTRPHDPGSFFAESVAKPILIPRLREAMSAPFTVPPVHDDELRSIRVRLAEAELRIQSLEDLPPGDSIRIDDLQRRVSRLEQREDHRHEVEIVGTPHRLNSERTP